MDWTQIAGTVLTVALGVGIIWKRASKILLALKELGEVLTAIAKAGEDKEYSQAELKQIKKEMDETLTAFKNVLK